MLKATLHIPAIPGPMRQFYADQEFVTITLAQALLDSYSFGLNYKETPVWLEYWAEQCVAEAKEQAFFDGQSSEKSGLFLKGWL